MTPFALQQIEQYTRDAAGQRLPWSATAPQE
jgi:hypothetical protein